MKLGSQLTLSCAMILLALMGCAPVKMAKSRVRIEASDAPNTIRVLGADQRCR